MAIADEIEILIIWQGLAYNSGNPTAFPIKEMRRNLPKFVIGIGLIINQSGQVLIDQRLNNSSMGGLWEFPGGKKEKNESIEMTIARELKEELAITVKVGKRLIAFEHSYSHNKLHFVVHLCQLISGTPQPLSSLEIKWVKIEELANYPFPVANQKIIDALKSYLINKDN